MKVLLSSLVTRKLADGGLLKFSLRVHPGNAVSEAAEMRSNSARAFASIGVLIA